MGINSREKGKRGEREWAAWLKKKGFNAHRGQQYKGGEDSPDVVCPVLDRYHFEVKRTEKLRLYDAVEQAVCDARPDQLPTVAHRRNREDWVIIMEADDWLRMAEPNWTTERKRK